jgi:predicted anti-sigma-YlaC factor YlaD
MIDNNRLREHLGNIVTTEDNEVDCDALGAVIEEVVEAAAAGVDVRALVPEIVLHLDHCADCRDWYDTLLALTREPA